METDQCREAWKNLLHAWGVSPIQADRTFDEIARAYSGPGHFYHTLDHVSSVLDTVDSLATHAKNLKAVKLAAWFHDAIYDSKASDNEGKSAETCRPNRGGNLREHRSPNDTQTRVTNKNKPKCFLDVMTL